ncbi:MAG: shikimate kinase [Culicoidibacterales bacterium]
MPIYLIGMMGAGKSTIGLSLSTYLQCGFIDLDKEIEKQFQMPISDIFSIHGERYFREAETTLFQQVSQQSQIIATGGGIIESEENCKLLKSGYTIFLRGSIDLLWERVQQDDTRPLAGVKSEFEKRYQARKSRYEMLSDAMIDIDGKTVKDIVAEILFLIAQIEGAR